MPDLFFYLLPFMIGGACSGIILGLLPFVLAIRRRRNWLACFALAVCVACGVILGAILAFPVATSFSAAILLTQPRERQPKPVKQPAFSSVHAEPVEAKTVL